MAFTSKQEEVLAAIADERLAEEAATVERNKQVVLDGLVNEAREAKRAELEAQAQALVADGLDDFEATVVPTIKLPKG